jgi:hypothetical protein
MDNNYYLFWGTVFWAAVVGIPLLLIVGAVFVDIRTRRGYGLTLLALAMMGLAIWGEISLIQIEQGLGNLASLIWFGIITTAGWGLSLILLIGALVEAGTARHGGWGMGLVGTLVVAIVLTILGLGLSQYWNEILPRWADAVVALTPVFPITLVVLAYGISRSVAASNAAPPRWPQRSL